jgi:hypothetical protein
MARVTSHKLWKGKLELTVLTLTTLSHDAAVARPATLEIALWKRKPNHVLMKTS